jgi:hypothetical protein
VEPLFWRNFGWYIEPDLVGIVVEHRLHDVAFPPTKVWFAADSSLERDGFEPSVPREGNYAHETAPFDRHGISRPFSTAAAPDLE